VILYKYMPEPYSLLDEGYIRATQLSALNDPFEGIYYERGLRNLSQAVGDRYKDTVRYVQEHIKKVGVICLTEAKDNLLMWSHYANNHKGIAVGFFCPEINDPEYFLFKKVHSRLGGYDMDVSLARVRYRNQTRFKIDRFDYDGGFDDGLASYIREILRHKGDSWIYEKEHRFIFPLSSADRVIVPDLSAIPESIRSYLSDIDAISISKTDGYILKLEQIERDSLRISIGDQLANLAENPQTLYLFKINKNRVQHIIKGVRCTTNHEDNHYPLFSNHSSFEVLQAKLNNDSYCLDILPANGKPYLDDVYPINECE